MEERNLLLYKLCKETEHIISLNDLTNTMGLNEFEVFELISELKRNGITIYVQRKDDDIYLYNTGEQFEETDTLCELKTENDEITLAVISDTRLGSKYEQLTILNDIYQKAYDLGCSAVLHCGNISEGLYSVRKKYYDTIHKDDTLSQADYIINHYPYVKGMNTYFINGVKDEIHLIANKINIGKRISDARSDLIYIGDQTCRVKVDNSSILMMNLKLGKTYTSSYRPQQMINSFRSEDKPDILLYGGLLQMEKFRYRDVDCITVPSVVATTDEMEEKRHSNVIGAWYLQLHVNEKGRIKKIIPMASPYYVTKKDDYKSAKVLKIGGVR